MQSKLLVFVCALGLLFANAPAWAAIGWDDSNPIVMDYVTAVPWESPFNLYQNYPNPMADGSTSIRFDLPGTAANLTLEIYDLRGALVRRLYSGSLPAGSFVFAWDGQDARHSPVSSGMYFSRLRSDEVDLIRKMVVTR